MEKVKHYFSMLLLFHCSHFSMAFSCHWYEIHHMPHWKVHCEDQEEHNEFGCLFKPNWRMKEHTAVMIVNGCLVESTKYPSSTEGGLTILYTKTYCLTSSCGTILLPYLNDDEKSVSRQGSGKGMPVSEGPPDTQANNEHMQTPKDSSGRQEGQAGHTQTQSSSVPGEFQQGGTNYKQNNLKDGTSEEEPSGSYMDSSSDGNRQMTAQGKPTNQYT